MQNKFVAIGNYDFPELIKNLLILKILKIKIQKDYAYIYIYYAKDYALIESEIGVPFQNLMSFDI